MPEALALAAQLILAARLEPGRVFGQSPQLLEASLRRAASCVNSS